MNTTKMFELLIVLVLAVAPMAAQEKTAPAKDEPVAAQDKAVPVKSEAVADKPAPSNKPGPTTRTTLPQDQEYQRVLYKFMGTLTEKDFDHGITNRLAIPPATTDAENQYRTLIMAMIQQPHVGGKRGIGAINAPSHNFLLSTIESTNTIRVPPVWEEAMATFIKWDSPGNLYYDSRALKMRAFVTAAVKLMMVDDYLGTNAAAARADWNGYHLITAASSYPVFKDQLPAPVQKAYEDGLLRRGQKILAMGPKGEECDYEMSAAVGLWYAARATGDAGFAKEAEAYARKLCTDPRYFHPAGYWVEWGGLDLGFGGMANFWTVWLALASDWPFAKETVDKAYRLRAHLALPEPDGRLTGPCAFNNLLGSPTSEDQWHWDGTRDHAAAMITDEALCLIKLPTEEQLAEAMTVRTHTFNDHLWGLKNPPYKHPTGERYLDGDAKTGRYLRNDELRGYPWVWRIFPNGFNYPIEVNPGYEFYRKGAYAHLKDLQKQDSPMLKSPFLRSDGFIKNFDDAFVIAKQPTYAVILHTGPVGTTDPKVSLAGYNGPMGFGGGQLAAFWTPATGSVILGRRGGMAMRGTETRNFDKLDEWRLWPIHAVSGQSAAGKVFTSARIAQPAVSSDVKPEQALVKVSGTIPATIGGQEGGLEGSMEYVRTFKIDSKGVAVETVISGDGKDQVAELYETLPVFLDDANLSKSRVPPTVTIEFQSGDKWSPATVTYAEKVQAVRITRYTGAVRITFDKPQRVKLAPTEWKDTFLSRAKCRNVLVDLLDNGDKPAAVKDVKKISCRIEAVEKPSPDGKPSDR